MIQIQMDYHQGEKHLQLEKRHFKIITSDWDSHPVYEPYREGVLGGNSPKKLKKNVADTAKTVQ